MILLNGIEIKPTVFPDGTRQVWKLQPEIINAQSYYCVWLYESDSEILLLNQLDMLLEQSEDDVDLKKKKKIYIRYYLAKTLRTQDNIQEMIDDLFNLEEILTKDDILYIVIKEEVNETLENLLKHIWEQDGIYIVVQSLKRLQFNILKHTYVPPHKVLSKGDDREMRLKYNIMNDSQLPEISRFDPVAKAICIRPGEVCEIIRPSKTSIKSTYYRICV